MTDQCGICNVELPPTDLIPAGDGYVCPDCHDTFFDDSSPSDAHTSSTESRSPALAAFADAVDFFHDQLDQPIDDHQTGGHADRPTTPRAYFESVRGWTTETIAVKRLGWAPADDTTLRDHLLEAGHDHDAIRGTGLFTEDLRPLWQGRYVLPYFDSMGRPVYAISRATGDEGGGAAGYDGHPADFMSGKYAKPAHTKEYAAIDEPIFGLESLDKGSPVLITEGIADAITAHEAGYACLSPVTTQFKHRDREQLVDVLAAHDIERVYLVQDAEQPSTSLDENDRLTVEQFGPGVRGAVATAAYLDGHGIDARVAALPRPGLAKVDLDDYLQTWSGDLSPVLASAVPAAAHPAHDPETTAHSKSDERPPINTEGDSSALFDLDITDVAGLPGDYRGPSPLGHHGQSETYFVLLERKNIAYDHKYKVTYNPLTYLLCEAGERPPSNPGGPLEDAEHLAAWRQAKHQGYIPNDDPIPCAALRAAALENGYCDPTDIEDGWRLPSQAYHRALEYVRDECGLDPGRSPRRREGDSVAVLPADRRREAIASGWDWTRDSTVADDQLTIDSARDRCQTAIEDALQYDDRVLIDALPTLGKSCGTIHAAAATNVPVTMLTRRGHKEQYEQIHEWCDELGLTAYTLPSFTQDCPTARGDHDDEWADRVRDWYHRGATPQVIHAYAERELGQPLPCQDAGCPYASRWDFDPERFDVLIGHYTHAYKPKVTIGRAVVFDEFVGDAYETTLDHGLEGAVSHFLEQTDALPFDDYTSLLETRDNPRKCEVALEWFAERDLEPDCEQVFSGSAGRAITPLAVYTLLTSDPLGNGWERATLGDGRIGLVNRRAGRVRILQPPPLDYARATIAVDGTPTQDLWELALGCRLNHRQILTDTERREYIQDTLNLQLVRTTEAVKPYNSSDHVAVARDAALLEEVAETHDRKPALITTRTALDAYEQAGILACTDGEAVDGLVDSTQYYGNVLGSNRFADTRLGAVIGSNHFGDDYIQKWGAYAGHAVTRGDEKGTNLTYGTFGDQVLSHMRENETLQAAMRFGRDGKGTVVYVHTDTLPDWVPLAGEGRVIQTWSNGMRQVIEAATTRGEFTTAEIAAAPAVDIGERQALNILKHLVEAGHLDATVEGRGYVWRADGLHEVSDHGEVDLAPVDLDALEPETVHELARSSSSYTLSFGSRDEQRDGAPAPAPQPGGDVADRVARRGAPPPDDAT